jgi:GT2 family glycosyltransferase
MASGLSIDVRIPYSLTGHLSRAYNEAAGQCAGWFAFADHDVWLATNPWWYELCVRTIQAHGHGVGLFTCYTNRIGNKLQLAPGVDQQGNDMVYHRNFARALYRRSKGRVLDHTRERVQYSGFFMLSNRVAWERAGGFNEAVEGILHVDVDYCARVRAAGLRTLLIADLYMYHGYFRDGLPGKNTFERPKI